MRAGGRVITIIHYQLTDQESSTKQGCFPCHEGPLSALALQLSNLIVFEEKAKRKGQFSAHVQYEIMV